MTNNMPIIGKVLLFIALVGTIFIASTCFSARESMQTASGFEAAMNRDGKAALFVARGSGALMEARAAIGDLLVSSTDDGNRRALDELATARTAFVSDMETASRAARADAADIAALAAKGVQAIDVTCKRAIDMGAAATTPGPILASQAVFLQTCSPVLLDVATALTPLAHAAAEQEQILAADLTRSSRDTVMVTVAVAFGSLIAVSLLGFLTIRAWVSRPIRALAATMMRLAGGELATPIEGAGRRDEVGLMASSLQIFKDNAIKARTLEGEAAAMREAAEAERGRNAEQAARRAAEQADVVTAISTGLSSLARGALTYRIEREFAGEYDTLRTDFNAAMAKLEDTITVVTKNTWAIRSGTGEISTAADDLARRTEQQAASLEETAAALGEITATVRKTAVGSKHARTVVSATRQGTSRSAEIVRQAIEAMSDIERSSGQIGQIIGVIDEIAFQTSLLALNAGVEAARAGDAGRGFAVVASEVRALAQRSAQAAKEIKTLIAASSAQVGQGVHMVAETGKGLERIVAQVTEISGIIDDIAAAAHEQANGLDQVNTAVNQMDKVTQQNAAMVEESNAASHALLTETEGLSRVIAGFTVGEDVAALQRPAAGPSGSRSYAKAAA